MTDLPPLDEPVLKMLERSRRALGRPIDPTLFPQYRAASAAAAGDRTLADGVTLADIDAGGVPVRLYRPADVDPAPLHVWFHGGGFMFGSALSGEYDGQMSRRAAAASCVVASVEYRLAPEHRFPAGVEDSYAALVGLVGLAGQLGFAPQAVTLGGVSSGGLFAAVVAQMARDRGGPPIALQLLEISGMDLTKSSYAWRNARPEHDTTRERDLAMVDLYLNSVAERGLPYASPLLAADLAGLPPAYVMNAEHDPRRDECEAYVARLADAGVAAVARTLPGHIHGSMGLPGWPPAQAWQAEANAALKSANAAALAGRAVAF